MARSKLLALKKEVRSHLKEDTHEFKEGLADDKKLLKKMKGKSFSNAKVPMRKMKSKRK